MLAIKENTEIQSLMVESMSIPSELAALIGALSGVIGLYLSFYVSVASGAAIVLVCTAFFVLALLFAPRRGLLWRSLRPAR